MSYEGRTEVLCVNGHYHVYDAYDAHVCDEDGTVGVIEWSCPVCDGTLAWTHEIDDTNGEGVEYPLTVKTPPKMTVCACCGHAKVLAPAEYHIPEQ